MPLFYSVAEQQWAEAPEPMKHCLGNGLFAFHAVNFFCHGGHLHHNCCSHCVPRHVQPQDSGQCPLGWHNPASGHALRKLLVLWKRPVCKNTTRSVPNTKPSSLWSFFSPRFVAVLSSPARPGMGTMAAVAAAGPALSSGPGSCRDTHGSHWPAARVAPNVLIVSLIDF